MSGACKEHLEDLPLYAEGELDPLRERVIRLHLAGCPGCRDWLSGYDDLTRKIFESDLAGSFSAPPDDAPPAGEIDPIEADPASGGWAFRVIHGDLARDPVESVFADRVMAEVRRGAPHGRRFSRLARMAAAILIAGGLAAAGSILLESNPAGPGSGPEIARTRGPGMSPVAATPVSDRSGTEPAERRMGVDDLASAWWMVDPDHEDQAGVAKRLEALLYAVPSPRTSPEGAAAEREAERVFVTLKGLLGPTLPREAASVGSELVMVPEGGGSDAIPIRPVARPVSIPEREISGSKRMRLHAPARRYRLIWVGPERLPVRIEPDLEQVRDDRPLRFPSSPSELPPDLPLGPVQ